MGFFNSSELQMDSINKGKPSTCISCGLYKKAVTPKMEPYGNNNKKVLFISSAPTELDDKKGKPWQNPNGKILQNILNDFDFNIYNDAITTYVCRCTTKEINSTHMNCCFSKLKNSIKKYRPKVIVLFGNKPLQSIIGNLWKKNLGTINKWRGWCIPDKAYNAFICPTFDPDLIFNEENENIATLSKNIFINDIKRALSFVKKRRPSVFLKDYTKGIEYIENDLEFKQIMEKIKKVKLIAFDLETTGLKPHHKDQKIVCTAVAYTGVNCAVWENTPFRDKEFAKVLRNKNILKSAHNIPFENNWCYEKIGIVRGWHWCSMNATHILDNRKGICSLKYQVAVNFGEWDYDSEINPYLKSDKDDVKKYGGNAINKIQKFIEKYGVKPVMKYCALDALYGYNLTTMQMQKVDEADDIPY